MPTDVKRDTSLGTEQKALDINLDSSVYGTIVEIGAGQEVARQFFKAGAAAGTVAKTMSAYDMKVSDDIYGQAGRYVSRERLEQMLNREFSLLVERLQKNRNPETTFFSYAATVSAKSYKKNTECHGWVGLSFQSSPAAEPSRILLHVRMLDSENHGQSDALGVLGVNLIYAAYRYLDKPLWITESLSDNLGPDRIEIDFVDFSGPAFEGIDNRLMNLHLIRAWLTRAVMFTPNGQSVVPAEALYKKSALVLRGSFKPPVLSTVDMAEQGLRQFLSLRQDTSVGQTLTIAEVSMSELMTNNKVDDADFLARVDLATALGYHVLVSDYVRLFSLRSWLRRYSNRPIGITIKALDFTYLFDDSYYDGVEGGLLEAMGRLFADETRVLVYPSLDAEGSVVSLDNVPVAENHRLLLDYLVANGMMLAADNVIEANLHTNSREVFNKIGSGEAWEKEVPASVAEQIKQRGLFGYRPN